MERLKALKAEFEYLYAAWNFVPSLVLVGGSKGQLKKTGLVQLASELGIEVHIFDSLASQEMQSMLKEHKRCRQFMFIRVLNGEEELNPIKLFEEVLKDAIGY